MMMMMMTSFLCVWTTQEERSCSAGDEDQREMPTRRQADDVRLYENLTTDADRLTVDDWVSLPPAASAQGPLSSASLIPVDAAAVRRASSSTSSSACDSVLELSSRCSGGSEPIAAAAAEHPASPGDPASLEDPAGDSASLEDPASLPDSGNGSADAAAVEQFWFPRLPADRTRPPAAGVASYCLVANFIPEWDAERLSAVYDRLSQCGFYYGRLSIDAAAERLAPAQVGTFLLRDSSDDRRLFAISVQTCRGTTSIRVIYHAGLFRLDSSPDQEHLMPTFDCALRLVSHYARICRSERRPTATGYVFLESSGRRDTPVVLRRPLYRRVGRLAHLCRRAVHRALSRGPAAARRSDSGAVVDRLQLVPSLKCYLKDYPYEL